MLVSEAPDPTESGVEEIASVGQADDIDATRVQPGSFSDRDARVGGGGVSHRLCVHSTTL